MFVVAVVDIGRPKGIEEVSVGDELDPVEAGGFHALARRAVILDDSLQVPCLQGFGGGAMRTLAHARGRHDGQPVALIPSRAPSQVRNLNHDGSTQGVAPLAELLQGSDDFIAVEV